MRLVFNSQMFIHQTPWLRPIFSDVMAEFEQWSGQIEPKGIPEARLEKTLILSLHFDCITKMVEYNNYPDKARKRIAQRDFQSSLIGLFSKLKVKLKKKESEELQPLDNSRYNNDVLNMKYLIGCFDLLSRVIERLGITEFEVARYDPGRSMA